MLNPAATASDMKPMTGAEENRHFLRAFIHTYRDLPVLWDTSLRDYTNREKRAEAYEQLVPIYRYLKRDATVEDVKKKINTLRTNYRKELKVVECARRSGTMHQPRCWTFHELDFLRNTEKFLAVNPNTRGEPFAFSDNSQTQTSFMESQAHHNYNFRAMMGVGATTQSPPNIAEMFQKSFGHTQKMEPEQTPPPPPPPPANGHASHAGTTADYGQQSEPAASAKRQRLSSATSCAATAQSPEELLSIACDYLSGTFPEEESIARTWTHKLKRMQREQRLLAEKFINEILFEAETGTLHRGSVQINSFEPYVRFEEQQSEEQAKSQSPSVHTSSMPHEADAKNVSNVENAAVGSENNYDNYNN